jgi:DNA-binding protein YbaB
MVDMQSILESIEQHRKKLSETGAANKAIVFEALSAAGIDLVDVTFDGEGDSGQIDNIIAWKAQKEITISDQTVAVQSASWDGKDVAFQELPLREAIERLCYDFLEQEHGGWENNDGAFGTFAFDVTARTIELEFNGRFTDIATNTYSF